MGPIAEPDWRVGVFKETEETGEVGEALCTFYGVRLKESTILHSRSPAAKKESAAGAAWIPDSLAPLPFLPSLPRSHTHGLCTHT